VSWFVAIGGLLMFIAPAWTSYAGMSISRANDMVVGFVVLVLGIVNAVYHTSPVRTHA
jgi:hypothetical protein